TNRALDRLGVVELVWGSKREHGSSGSGGFGLEEEGGGLFELAWSKEVGVVVARSERVCTQVHSWVLDNELVKLLRSCSLGSRFYCLSFSEHFP
ncbi:hypothetical protein Drorol1_Dr00027226, partial [Drosera rotundifolia]